MPRILALTTPEEVRSLPTMEGLPFDPETLAQHRADEHLVLLDEEGRPEARVSLWWKEVPAMEGQRIGAIGHYAAVNEAASSAVLTEAGERLRQRGCTLAVGPMDGTTWRRYRLLSERGTEPSFLLEPNNPETWPEYWEAAGYAPLATYFSGLNQDLSYEDPQIARAGERLQAAGVVVRALRVDEFEEELRRIYAVSVKAFPSNFLYTPLPEAAFVSQYLAIRERVRPELVLLAEHAGQPVGYIFNVPDWLRGPATDTVIVKTLAVCPGRQFAGLGAWLLARGQIVARELGYRRVIHALMHESNNSLNLSARYGKPFRRYTLYSRAL